MPACHTTSTATLDPRLWLDGTRPLRVALAGSPNVGKSTVFNQLTGSSQHTGNWTGKTVEHAVGYYQQDERQIEIVDLPGTYSLTANSAEEQVARDYLLLQRPDAVIAVVSAANLERNLYLVAELLDLPAPLVVGVNMIDVAESEGIHVEVEVLQAALGVPVVPLIAARGVGMTELVTAAESVARGAPGYRPRRPGLDEPTERVVERILDILGESVPDQYPARWVAVKLLEGDAAVYDLAREWLAPPEIAQIDSLLARNEDAVVAIASARYEWVERMVRAAVVNPRPGAISRTERLDRVATHPIIGPLILLGVLGLIFWLDYQVARPFIGLLGGAVSWLAGLVHVSLDGIAPWLGGLVADGILGGAGSVLTLLPVVAIFFAAMALLEDVGYMARAAFVADRYMHRIGLHGKSFLPLFLGFGCNVPAVLGTRIIESRRARLLTIFLASLVPCSGRLAVLVFIAGALFGANAPFVTWGIIAASIGVLALTGAVASRLVSHGESPAFIMELPLYHSPNWRSIGRTTSRRIVDFVARAGTLILAVSAIVWAIAALPSGDIQTGFLATAGRFLEPAGRLMGLDWRLIVALITSFVAKENTVATLAVLTAADGGSLSTVMPTLLTPAAGIAFLVAQVFFVPCVATVSAIYQETGSLRLTVLNVGYLLVLSLGSGVLVYQVARLLGLGV